MEQSDQTTKQQWSILIKKVKSACSFSHTVPVLNHVNDERIPELKAKIISLENSSKEISSTKVKQTVLILNSKKLATQIIASF